MKRYLAFKGDDYYPGPGMTDFVGDFAELSQAVELLTAKYKTRQAWGTAMMWALVWDSESRKDVWGWWALPEYE